MGQLFSITNVRRVLRFYSVGATNRVGAWAFLTLGSLGLLLDILRFNEVNMFYGLLTVLGLWMIVRHSGLIDAGDTVEHLRLHAGKASAGHAHAHHVAPHHALGKPIKAIQVVLLVAAGILLVAAATYLYDLSRGSFFLITLLTSLVITWFGRWRGSDIWFGTGSLLVMTTMFAAVDTLQPAEQFRFERLSVSYMAPLLLLMVCFYLSSRRRTLENSAFNKVLLTTTCGVYLCVLGWMSPFNGDAPWQIGLLSLLGISGAFALYTWIKQGRHSFAKHFLVVSIAALTIFCYLYMSITAVTLIITLFALVALLAGFLLPSYTARMVGLGLLKLSFLQYMLMILGDDTRAVTSITQLPAVWIGAVLAILYLVVAWWYEAFQASKPAEKLLKSVIQQGLVAGALGIALAIAATSFDAIYQSLTYVLWGVAVITVAKANHLQFWRWIGAGVGALGAIQLFLLDLPALSDTARLLSFAAFAILILLISLWIGSNHTHHGKHYKL